jgi:hypothetical protein
MPIERLRGLHEALPAGDFDERAQLLETVHDTVAIPANIICGPASLSRFADLACRPVSMGSRPARVPTALGPASQRAASGSSPLMPSAL